jgi:GNAT superfamily N-acetyltransferase
MSDELHVAIEDPPLEDTGEINRRLVAFNRRIANRPNPQRFAVTLRDNKGALRGGITAISHWDVLFIDDFWIDEDLQGRRLGSRLLAAVEREGLNRGANIAYLDTFSWQARPFYEKQGYTVFGELPYANGQHKRFFMSKVLDGPQ